ncbi:class I SAM-dependent methyltransferase [Streptomyces cinnabarinus]|uniref:Class I SAM-dependent methyltransferase n=1 Tax=Streptomyces cinnabarinus TaxID=67287 RepID=A0ABY7K7N2_9ACTN|nr:class I SAM-dependent methyltransferase [Streptomyces cinnabarinus]WAZ20522.1 class I SAM-dependent methyltransferase [Streptomyces cinnabarinus]
MSEFDTLAWFYDRHWGPDYAAVVIRPLRELLLEHLPRDRPLLDACCGTGHATALFAEWGFRTAGFDLSPAMLARARVNAPSARLWAADVRRCGARSGAFGAVVSTYNSLDHLPRGGDALGRALGELGRVLAPGGVLFFDLNTVESAARTWHGSFVVRRAGAECRTDSDFDLATGTGRARLRITRAGKCEEAMITLSVHPLAEVTAALERAGLRRRRVLTAAELGLGALAGRLFVLAERV